MKNRFLQPGFETIFSLGIVAILCIPQLIMAQAHKDVRIIIKNNDTLYNGKNIKDLSAPERQAAVTEITRLGTSMPPEPPRVYGFRSPRHPGDGDSSRVRVYTFRRDSTGRGPRHTEIEHSERMGAGGDRPPGMQFRMEGGNRPEGGFSFDDRRPAMRMEFRHRDQQNFSFSNTDRDGINTHISYSVSTPHPEDMKRIAVTEKSGLELKDIALTPMFSAGKTILAFTLPAKTADVQLTDSEGQTIWKDKTGSETFTKTFSWPMNGVYYLIVKQGGKMAVKRIVKE